VSVTVMAERAVVGAVRTRATTPALVRLALIGTFVPLLAFAFAVRVAVDRSEEAVRTVGQESTRGITAAQGIKAHLSELDGLVAEALLTGEAIGPSGFPASYNDKRAELIGSLVLASSNSPPGAAYEQPLADIDYALGHYHTMVHDSFAAARNGDRAAAAGRYAAAHDVVTGTLLPRSDSFDKANTYVLNGTYDRHTSDSARTRGIVLGCWALLLAALLGLHLLLTFRFRRLVNPAIVAAAVVVLVVGAFSVSRLRSSSSALSAARERAFEAVHELARARSAVVSARQAQGQVLLDPAGATASGAAAGFAEQANLVFRVADGDPVTVARSGVIPEDAGGYLARVLAADVSDAGTAAAREAVTAFADLVEENTRITGLVASGDRSAAQATFAEQAAFGRLIHAIDVTQSLDQRTFDLHAHAADEGTDPVNRVDVIGVLVVAALLGIAVFPRLREYRE
jgi:hypothetical protein